MVILPGGSVKNRVYYSAGVIAVVMALVAVAAFVTGVL